MKTGYYYTQIKSVFTKHENWVATQIKKVCTQMYVLRLSYSTNVGVCNLTLISPNRLRQPSAPVE